MLLVAIRASDGLGGVEARGVVIPALDPDSESDFQPLDPVKSGIVAPLVEAEAALDDDGDDDRGELRRRRKEKERPFLVLTSPFRVRERAKTWVKSGELKRSENS